MNSGMNLQARIFILSLSFAVICAAGAVATDRVVLDAKTSATVPGAVLIHDHGTRTLGWQ